MATIKIIDVIKRAEIIIQDFTNTRWPKAEWLDWFNDAVLAVVSVRPDSHVTLGDFTIETGSSKQAIPDNGLKLIDVICNSDSGSPIRIIDRRILDDNIPTWHKTSGEKIEHYVYDDRYPKLFHIYPQPSQSNYKIELAYSTAPVPVSISNFDSDLQVLPIDDTYLNPILEFMLHRAYSKDAEYAENAARSNAHITAFNGLLNVKAGADSASSPNAKG